MMQHSSAQNTIEGHNGNLKHKLGVYLIFCKLDENAKTEAALNILAMNTVHQLCRWLIYLGFFENNHAFLIGPK